MAFVSFQEPSATPRLLRLIQRWMKEQARGGGGGGSGGGGGGGAGGGGGGGGAGGGASSGRQQGDVQDWAALSAESKEFLGISSAFFVFAGAGRGRGVGHRRRTEGAPH